MNLSFTIKKKEKNGCKHKQYETLNIFIILP